MSARELRALHADGKGAETTGTRSGKERTRGTLNRTISEGRLMEALKAQVEDLQLQLQEAQNAIEVGDQELKRVSAECERLSGEARAVRDLASGVRD